MTILLHRSSTASSVRFFSIMKYPSILLLGFPLCAVAQPFSPSALEAIGRQDPTGSGTFHRIGMLREQENTVSRFEQLTEKLSGQVRANTMLFASDNIFNTPNNKESDSQLAEFIGTNVRVAFSDELKLNTSYDAAFFRHNKKANSGNDFDTSTFRQQLAYERFIFDNKASVGIPLSWQYSEVYRAGGGDPLARTWTYSSGVELSWFPNSRVFPSFSYNYFLSDPKAGAGKNKHDFNLGVTLIPFPGKRLYVIPSIQYSYEDFKKSGRTDKAWTPTLTTSWSPLTFFALDAVGSYTDSASNVGTAEFDAFTATLFARLFWNW
jgi:hypothetical protein